ncbi:sulfatase-like hydrolase/transferase [Tamlana sp. 2201CG12-4]|uniref:sulfatase-like hydrolase/transferase n=1 Tax=Tamlana sp. 2201CG12-4 TaxID=3112582 RepID=UPI002DBE7846|nr:sulfatase-like hydrolase/transferase [Tamlana sp. 2201CG12-4]MEC3905730.1 sulfatase-like hydrolase/transferase [Tamlana sp. 2201CG12-4]
MKKLNLTILIGLMLIANSIAQTKPNVVLILADDLGYGDVGYHGGKEIPTPNIDELAEHGTNFSAGYAMAPVCAPSRAGLLTGRYQNRFGFEDNPGGPFRQTVDTKPGIPLNELTLGEFMKSEGYKTAWIGKDHQGKYEQFMPYNRGFDFFFGFNNGASSYFVKGNNKQMLLKGNKPVRSEPEYLTDAFGREAVNFIERNKKKPFFLYVPFNAIHGPLQATPKDLKKFKHIKNKKRQTLAAMHSAMDRNIGKIIDKLKEHNLEENTLVIFYSDNGGKPNGNHSYNHPLKGQKGTVLEGGIRVPFVFQWKGKIKAKQQLDFPVAAIDIYSTIYNAINSKVELTNALDGINLMPYLKGEEKAAPADRNIYWRFLYQWAIRNNEWKLLKLKGKDKAELYHISEDISESKNVIEEFPEVAKKLKNEFDLWSDTMIEPQWSYQGSFGGPINVKKAK